MFLQFILTKLVKAQYFNHMGVPVHFLFGSQWTNKILVMELYFTVNTELWGSWSSNTTTGYSKTLVARLLNFNPFPEWTWHYHVSQASISIMSLLLAHVACNWEHCLWETTRSQLLDIRIKSDVMRAPILQSNLMKVAPFSYLIHTLRTSVFLSLILYLPVL